jgi:hypothetical protein
MKTIGIILLSIGIILGIYALTMDVSVKVDYPGGNPYGLPDRVNNLGLMNDRQNYSIFAGVLSIIGIVLVLIPKKRQPKTEEHEYKKHQELAKKAEYKGQISEAIDHYMDALYHLENDYQNLSKKKDEARLKLVASLKEKVDNLKTSIQKEAD